MSLAIVVENTFRPCNGRLTGQEIPSSSHCPPFNDLPRLLPRTEIEQASRMGAASVKMASSLDPVRHAIHLA